ncbi:MAG: tRNA lysidine(34) synthetase TilS [Proteobacteria bacterium]|nr:tRNA lysidine(34) synthetase TilS [Cystobacterineae bacterium]MCL2258724.1 tRNA lysidine(34) synthetase TilS [Cystobacterineae bacterium]MCL2314898.1 tRNA lysidine(34) synthetase TilS [Pseudomonadota bacterium]
MFLHSKKNLLSFEKSLYNNYLELNLRRERLLLAVSGGVDSLALLLATSRISSKLSLHVEVASIHHGLREEGAQEVDFVRALSAKLGTPFHTQNLNMRSHVALEERARHLRYAALEEIRERRCLNFILTAHTASDQACTLLMRLSRGAALSGARGIWRRRGYLLRPMLTFRRAEVEHYLKQTSLSPVMDFMNKDERFFRVRMRRGLLRMLEDVAGASATLHLAQFCRYADEDEAFLQQLALRAFQKIQVSPTALDVMGFLCLEKPLQRRVLALLLSQHGLEIDSKSIENSVVAIQTKKNATLAQDSLLKSEKGLIFIEAAPPRKKRLGKKRLLS